MFAFRGDQCLTAVTQEFWLQYVRIFCWFIAVLWDLSCKSLEQPAVFWVLCASRSCWLATMSMCACGRTFALVMQGGVILPCHPPCSTVLRWSLCLHVESGDAGWGQHLLASPFLRFRQWFWRVPPWSVAGLLILQGLNHLLSPAKKGETGKGPTSLHLTAESWWRRGKLPFPLPTQQPKWVRYSPEAKATLYSESAGRGVRVVMVFVHQQLQKRPPGLPVCLSASCR